MRSDSKPRTLHWRHAALGIAATLCAWQPLARAAPIERIQLDLRPRICTLANGETACEATVRASWRSTQSESLCLIIVERADVKQCWENQARGAYSIELQFSEDLAFQLRDPGLQEVLATKTLRVIREALEFRRRRRQPWNIIY